MGFQNARFLGSLPLSACGLICFPPEGAAESGIGSGSGAGDVAHGVVPAVLLVGEGDSVDFEFVVGMVKPFAGAVAVCKADIVNEGNGAEIGGKVVNGFAEFRV